MDLYTAVAYEQATQLTRAYSTSFNLATHLVSKDLRQHIYAIYALVRVADEIVDSYRGADMATKLAELESEVQGAIHDGFSAHPIVHAFADTCNQYGIDQELIKPFFASMHADVNPPKRFSQIEYERYIHGSAGVVGLMCLKVFCETDNQLYAQLQTGAQALGSAFQKVNFLRDLAADWQDLHRYYFPIGDFESFDNDTQESVIADIQADMNTAREALIQLPPSSRKAVALAYNVYSELLDKLQRIDAQGIKSSRVRVNNWKKSWLLVMTACGHIAKEAQHG